MSGRGLYAGEAVQVARKGEVFIDGKIVTNCYVADTRYGAALCYGKDERGHRKAVAVFGEVEVRSVVKFGSEFCICAAIKMPDGEVIHGHRHNNCFDAVRGRPNAVIEDIRKAEQGFVTSTGRFVGRQEAMDIQKLSGRPSCYGKDGKYCGDILFSEDLY